MKSVPQHLWRALFALACAVALHGAIAAAVIAADEHHAAAQHEHAGEHHAPTIDQLLFPAINFSIYLFIVVRFVIPAMREYLRRRHSDIVEAQAEANTALTRAQGDLAASKSRLAGLQDEAEAIRQDLIAIAKRQAERLKAQAEESGARRLADAALLAEQERRRAMSSLRSELASSASRLAEDRVKKALTADDQRAFIQEFLKEAGAR